jgi:predicted transcriptional regulator
MSETTKTTLYLDALEYRRLKEIARGEGRTTAQLVREAVAAFIASRPTAGRPSSIGAGRSGRGDVAARAEQLLTGMGRRK